MYTWKALDLRVNTIRFFRVQLYKYLVHLIFFFLLLSNDVEAGGGTNFPELDLTVMPKRGRVLIWPSVLDDDPNEKDDRTDHQALPVEAGKKYGANAWLHMRDFKVRREDEFLLS